MTKEDAYIYINNIYNEQIPNKSFNGVEFHKNSAVAQNIIKLYFRYIGPVSITEVIEKFKKRYIINETMIAQAHNDEQKGLGEMYNYIQDFNCDNKITIYHLNTLNQLIFSKCVHTEGGGKFREGNVYLPGSKIEIPDFGLVPELMQKLYIQLRDILTETSILKNDENFDIISYIRRCIKIKCSLIWIHPFYEGNGRSSRGFLNLLLKNVGLPFVFINEEEKQDYGVALNKAIVDGDYQPIEDLYFCKICDSIYELDIKPKMEMSIPIGENRRVL